MVMLPRLDARGVEHRRNGHIRDGCGRGRFPDKTGRTFSIFQIQVK